jgi:hypothetical protein
MKKIASALLVSLFAVGAFAQSPAPVVKPAPHAAAKPATHGTSHAKKKTATKHAATHPKSAHHTNKHAKKSTKTHVAKKAAPHHHKTV